MLQEPHVAPLPRGIGGTQNRVHRSSIEVEHRLHDRAPTREATPAPQVAQRRVLEVSNGEVELAHPAEPTRHRLLGLDAEPDQRRRHEHADHRASVERGRPPPGACGRVEQVVGVGLLRDQQPVRALQERGEVQVERRRRSPNRARGLRVEPPLDHVHSEARVAALARHRARCRRRLGTGEHVAPEGFHLGVGAASRRPLRELLERRRRSRVDRPTRHHRVVGLEQLLQDEPAGPAVEDCMVVRPEHSRLGRVDAADHDAQQRGVHRLEAGFPVGDEQLVPAPLALVARRTPAGRARRCRGRPPRGSVAAAPRIRPRRSSSGEPRAGSRASTRPGASRRRRSAPGR